MVRTVISLDSDDKAWLDRKAKRERTPMTRLVQRAIKRLREDSKADKPEVETLLRETAGLKRFGDGLEYQRKLRSEWRKRR